MKFSQPGGNFFNIGNRSCPDISPTVSVICRRARDTISDNWENCDRLVKYINDTQELHLVLEYEGLLIA